VRVSPLQLGAMSIGEAWAGGMGSMDKAAAFKLLDAFYDAGGNFIDTANNYQNEQSECWIGEWAHARKNRDSLVLATKFGMDYCSHAVGRGPQAANFAGNSRRSIHVSVRNSLLKLQTDYIGECRAPGQRSHGSPFCARQISSMSTSGTTPPRSRR
jgi:aryl-alcohol dehydrogenase-like predicted oxidoreductase